MKRPLVAAFVLSAMVIAAVPVAAGNKTHPLTPFACQTQRDLYELLNALDRRDAREEERLEGTACQRLEGVHYEIIKEMNGVSTIRVFAQEGDWEHSHIAYTLDEMISSN
jgi:hypothetical protein